jgi:hypothetical protein
LAEPTFTTETGRHEDIWESRRIAPGGSIFSLTRSLDIRYTETGTRKFGKLRNGTTVAFCVLGSLRPSADAFNSKPWVDLGDLGSNWVDIGGQGHPFTVIGRRIGRKLKKSFCFFKRRNGFSIFGMELTHEIIDKSAQMEAVEPKRERDWLRSGGGNRKEQVFSNLNNADTRTVRVGLVK